ncbi:MAG: 3'-5' exonuclease [Streptococcaceae bacterium]|nr:3'-5' exonuclease [Streptococcaceae bacterium]MCL2681657.1 3'-5' exonuclease [Streptococcaceae bacterium]MCL2858863.1 3'-5' exonuclease [Streptococcaceae bacterium]
MTQPYVVFDFETTGIDPIKNEIIQIGAIKYDENDQEMGRVNQLVKPTHSYVSSRITELTGIAPADVVYAPEMKEVIGSFVDFLEGHLLVAHNAPFDLSFLNRAIRDCGVEAKNFEIFDTLAESRRLFKRKSHKLESYKAELGVDVRSHDALNDCLVTAKLYQKLLAEEELKKAKTLSADNTQGSLFDEADESITEEIRRALNLPITKDLVYYHKDKDKKWSKYALTGIRLMAQYSVGYSLIITLYDGQKINIHSDYLKEMQKVGFVNQELEE